MKEGSDRSRWPSHVETGVVIIMNHLDSDYKDLIKNTPYDRLISFNRFLGTYIRNNLGLWRGNDELMRSCLDLRNSNEYDPDVVSMILIEVVWKALNNERSEK